MSETKQDLVRGVVWSAVEKYSSMATNLVISMILARLLSPEDYGVVAIAMVIIFFLQIFCSMGIAPAIIQKKELSDVDIDNIYSFTIYLGLVFAVMFFMSSYIIANIYNNNLLIPVCQLLSIQVFFSAANMVPNALMLKNKKFKEIARRTVTLQIITGILSVLAALYSLGVFSLLISPVLSAIGIFLWNRTYYHVRFVLLFSKDSIRKIFSYSAYQFMFEFVNYFSRNLDKLLIGKYLSVSALGYYEKSYRLMQMPLNSLTSVVNPVLQPVLSEYQNNLAELCCKYEKIISFMAYFCFPTGVLLFISAEEIIIILFGKQWIPAIPAFEILSISVPLQIILSTTGSIFQACNATRNLFFVGLRNSLLTVAGFIIAIVLSGTIEAVAWGWTATSFICFMSSFYEFYYKIFHSPIKGLLSILIPPLVIAIILVLIYLSTKQFLSDNIYISFSIKTISVIAITFIVFFFTGQFRIFKEIKRRKYEKSSSYNSNL